MLRRFCIPQRPQWIVCIALCLVVWAGLLRPAQGGEALVAVAANFTAAAKDMGAAFTAKTGHTIKFSFGSTGKLYAQITQGAPFDAFLAADQKRPQRAEHEGYAVGGSGFTYAVGKLVLWSRDDGLVDGNGKILQSGQFQKLAITNPVVAPYGAAAVSTLKTLGVYDAIKSKVVEGNNLSQVHQYVLTGAAELGFISGSQVALVSEGSRWEVPDTLYTPIHQDAVLLQKGKTNLAASAFLAFLQSPAASQILTKYGYGMPQ